MFRLLGYYGKIESLAWTRTRENCITNESLMGIQVPGDLREGQNWR